MPRKRQLEDKTFHLHYTPHLMLILLAVATFLSLFTALLDMPYSVPLALIFYGLCLIEIRRIQVQSKKTEAIGVKKGRWFLVKQGVLLKGVIRFEQMLFKRFVCVCFKDEEGQKHRLLLIPAHFEQESTFRHFMRLQRLERHYALQRL